MKRKKIKEPEKANKKRAKKEAKKLTAQLKKEQKTLVMGLHRKRNVFLWCLLLCSLSFAVYKNFTAVDVRTIEKTTVEKQTIVDYAGIDLFVEDFAKAYHTFGADTQANQIRSGELLKYMAEDKIQLMNANLEQTQSVSTVDSVTVYAVEPTEKEHFYDVSYFVNLTVNEQKIVEHYKVRVYKDHNHYLVTGLPQITKGMDKANYKPKEEVNSVDLKGGEKEEVEDFLETFFKIYPSADKSELLRYAKKGVLEPIVGTEYVFSSLEDVKYLKQNGKQVELLATVRFVNSKTNQALTSEYDFLLERASTGYQIVDLL